VVDPRKNATADTTDYTMKYTYDRAHRPTTATDAENYTTSTGYDRDGRVVATTDQLQNTTLIALNGRGQPTEVRVPRDKNGTTITYRTTRYAYDQVGNQTKVTSPRGVATPDNIDPDDFATVSVYDALNRVTETRSPYDRDDARYNTPDITTYAYDELSRLKKLSAPPSAGQTVRNDTTYSYFDNGWTKTSVDPFDIATSYDYNDLGQQTLRQLTSAGGSSQRNMTWTYHPDGKLATRADEGVPVGEQVVVVDNSDTHNVATAGTWPTADTATNKFGPGYATNTAGTGADTFTWKLNVPQAGTYQVYARYPTVTGAATNARYTVTHSGGSTVATVNQTQNAGTWVPLGSYAFTEGNTHTVTLTDQAAGTVVADAVKLVRPRDGQTDAEKQDFTYAYDPNGNLTNIGDASPGARINTYAVGYTGLNQVQQVKEQLGAAVKNTTTFAYDPNGAPELVVHDKQRSTYTYDERNLLKTVNVATSASDPTPKVTSYTYSARGQRQRETKGNANTVDYTYFLDGLQKYQVEKRSDGFVVSEHSMTYDLNGNRITDNNKKMRADNQSAYVWNVETNTYDPRDRIASLTRTGDTPGTETYLHDANNNVIEQTIKGTTTTFGYDRNRLTSSSSGGIASAYNYDPFGRLDTVTAGGQLIERNIYDGFDHVVENRKRGAAGALATTRYAYDPLDRTASKTTDLGTAKQKTTNFTYLGLSSEVLDEDVAGAITKSYQYTPWGERLSQVTHNTDGTKDDAYYGYNPHTDVEQVTDETGNTEATYGYTAYGNNDDAQFTGIDRPDPADPTKEPYNVYRYNAKRFDPASGTYDMGFRDYSPGLNRFLVRDTYNGALADLNLATNPYTGNRYAFTAGNPITNIELDGHRQCEGAYTCDATSGPDNQKDPLGGIEVRPEDVQSHHELMIRVEEERQALQGHLSGHEDLDSIRLLKLACLDGAATRLCSHEFVLYLDQTYAGLATFYNELDEQSRRIAPYQGVSAAGDGRSAVRVPWFIRTSRSGRIVADHLQSKDLSAARRELRGEVVARRRDGTPYDHVKEVRDAQAGLYNRIGAIKRRMNDTRSLTPEERADLQIELSYASRMLDYSYKYVPPIV
jgi:RHS repeat-associated protein